VPKHSAGRFGCPRKVPLPSLNKLGLTKHFVKALQRDEKCSKCHYSKFLGFSEEKLKEWDFVGPNITKFISDEMFETTMPNVETKARIALKYVTRSFFWGGGYRKQNYKKHLKPHAEQI
jgi:hypothetical protein